MQGAITTGVPGLGSDPHLISAIFHHISQPAFSLTITIEPGSVEVANTAIDGFIDDANGIFCGAILLINDHLTAKTQDWEFLTDFSEGSCFHFSYLPNLKFFSIGLFS